MLPLPYAKQEQIGLLVNAEPVAWHFNRFDQAGFDFNMRAKHRRDFHRAREIIDVERFGIDFCDSPSIQKMDQPLDGARRHFTPVHPTIERQHECRVLKLGAVFDSQGVVL